jgi:hypothetical protein
MKAITVLGHGFEVPAAGLLPLGQSSLNLRMEATGGGSGRTSPP